MRERQVLGLTLFGRDITARKEAEARLGEMHRTLVDVSRQAGMAEIATGVLHNVGNTLNSVNISTGLVMDQLRQSRVVDADARPRSCCRSIRATWPPSSRRIRRARSCPPYLIARRTPSCRRSATLVLKEMRGAQRERRSHQVHRHHAAEARAHGGDAGAGDGAPADRRGAAPARGLVRAAGHPHRCGTTPRCPPSWWIGTSCCRSS